jgi:mRNA-degrading endonuclease RelE of RelBE toxin-antitoxin system
MYEIELAPSALEDLKSLRKFEQQQVVDVVETQLHHQPTVETRNRKRLRPNELADWELRAGRFRVFYNVDEAEMIVSIEAVGLKVGNLLFIRGESRKL